MTTKVKPTKIQDAASSPLSRFLHSVHVDVLTLYLH